MDRTLGLHKVALDTEIEGVLPGAHDDMDIDSWVAFIQATLRRLVEVTVPTTLILKLIWSFVPHHILPTRANAMHFLRSSNVAKLVGPALATQVSRLVLAQISEVPVTLMSDKDLHAAIKQDLMNSLAAQHCPPEEEDLNASPSKRRRMNNKQTQGWKENMAAKTDQVLWMVRNRVATTRVAQTITEGSSMVSKILKRSGSHDEVVLEDLLHGKESLRRHLTLLDGALDRCTSDHIFVARENNTFAGAALATDESPPSQPDSEACASRSLLCTGASFTVSQSGREQKSLQ